MTIEKHVYQSEGWKIATPYVMKLSLLHNLSQIVQYGTAKAITLPVRQIYVRGLILKTIYGGLF